MHIIKLGKATHFDARTENRTGTYPVGACGRMGSGLRFTRDPLRVDCYVCRKTRAYKAARKALK